MGMKKGGSTVNKAVVKASTHEVQGPKRKHLDYLVTLTGAPNVNLPELANQLVERTRNSSWVVVFKVNLFALEDFHLTFVRSTVVFSGVGDDTSPDVLW